MAAMVGGAVAIGYIPILRSQIRDGEVGIPLGTINPLRVRRDSHPRLFLLVATGLGVAIALLIVVCAIILVTSL